MKMARRAVRNSHVLYREYSPELALGKKNPPKAGSKDSNKLFDSVRARSPDGERVCYKIAVAID